MKNNNFHIELLKGGKLLVVPTTFLRPEYYLEQLENILSSHYKNVSCVYFDFLIKNGTKDRFYKVSISDHKLIHSSFAKADDDNEIIEKSNSFFSNNLNLINDSYLPKAQKFLLRKNLSINTSSNLSSIAFPHQASFQI